MSKRSRRRNARNPGKTRMTTEQPESLTKAKTTEQTPVPVPSPRRRSTIRRLLWLLAVAGLIAVAGFAVNKTQNDPRPGIIEYSSDDPNAQVILEKDGEETLLKQGTKFTQQVAPGYYTKLRLANPTDELKLTPPFINMDPGGRAAVMVRRVQKSPPR
ncbi:MAG TPA: hypothetical protein VG122_12170 [Gemmata sp.]|jgi:P pilus assembly chaperone PapD|nr:hypothetical protein [Gemmata sp.]